MEETAVTTPNTAQISNESDVQSSQNVAQSASVKRKPVASAATTTGLPDTNARFTQNVSQHPPPTPPAPPVPEKDYWPPKEYGPSKEYLTAAATTSTFATAAPPAATTQPSLYHRLRIRFSLLSKRKKILVIAIPVTLLLILIIGLSAGLATRSRTSNLPLPSNHGGPYTGDLTYYDPALGSCGITSSSSEAIVAVSHVLYDAVSVGSNPNANPLCGKKIRVRREGYGSIDVTVVDRCVGCKATDLDVTRSVFSELAGGLDAGRVVCSWSWLEDVPGGAQAA